MKMIGRMVVGTMVLCCASIARAQERSDERFIGLIDNRPATAPSSAQPTTAPSTRPSSAVAAAPAARFAGAIEMGMKLRRMREQKAALSKVAYLDLSDPVRERPASFSLFGTDQFKTLRDITDRLHKVRDDKSVRGVLLTLGAEMEMNLAQAQEIRDTLLELRRVGKKTFVYADSYDTIGYTIASGATNVCLLEG
ncbi:MAG TPA: hypothetical protein VH518_00935, partial [Tepidisphaeraceae bacterium]